MLAWWAFNTEDQELTSIQTIFEIEHIYAKNRQSNDGGLTDAKNLERLGNKSLLEKRINIRASDYRFIDKKKYYVGFESARGYKEGTVVEELKKLAMSNEDFIEKDIDNRNNSIIDSFIEFIKANKLD